MQDRKKEELSLEGKTRQGLFSYTWELGEEGLGKHYGESASLEKRSKGRSEEEGENWNL